MNERSIFLAAQVVSTDVHNSDKNRGWFQEIAVMAMWLNQKFSDLNILAELGNKNMKFFLLHFSSVVSCSCQSLNIKYIFHFFMNEDAHMMLIKFVIDEGNICVVT